MSKVVLAVEDEGLILEYLTEILTEAGFNVIPASNADEAIGVLEARSDIFALVTDIDMPGSMDGLRLAATVRDRWPPIQVVVTTGKNVGRRLPPSTHFLPKPYSAAALLQLVRRLH